MRKTFITILLAIATCCNTTAAQIGSWVLYPSYNNITEIAPAGNMCFALASGSLFSYSATNGHLVTYDKVSPLSDIDITHIRWAKTPRRLVVTYANGNIDLVQRDGRVYNVPDLYLKSTTKDKTINHVYVNGNYAYISMGFGVLKLNIANATIADTYQLDMNVNYCYIDGQYIYAAVEGKGLYRASLNDNLLDKTHWTMSGTYTPLVENHTDVKDETTNLWWTKTEDGKLTYYTTDEQGGRTYKTTGVLPEGPASNNFSKLYINGGTLYGVAGMWGQEKDGLRDGEVHVWNGTAWSEFEKLTWEQLGHLYMDHLALDFDPKTPGHVMVGSKSGLYEFLNGKFVKRYNASNSGLTSGIGVDNYTIVSALKYLPDGRLLALNSMVDNPIWFYDANATTPWTTKPHPELSSDSRYDLIDLKPCRTNSNVMWFVNNYYEANRLYAYDYVNDVLLSYGPIFNTDDGNALKPIYIFCVAEDKQGTLWLGTTLGPINITVSNALAGNGVFTQHKVPRNDGTNLADYLLTNVETRSIAIDGAGRKWMGTSNGVFLISADNNTQLAHFTTTNSPLPSNLVVDILADPNSNLVYFATDKGLCSYASDATEPNEEMTKDNVYAYPNPVTPDYTGYINIVGLTYNADVKIVTSNGTLVNQGKSTGGSYSWNGCDLKGKRVASGVYMVETATEDGSKGTVCKIAVVN